MKNIEFYYNLTEKNVLESVKAVKKAEGKGKKLYFYTAVFIALFAIFITYYIVDGGIFNLLVSLFCVSMPILLWWLPIKNEKQIAALSEEANETFYMCFSEENIYFDKGKTDFFKLSDVLFIETENTLTIDASDGRVFSVPKEKIEEKLKEFLKTQNYKDLRCLEENK